MNIFEKAVEERLEFLRKVKETFSEIYPDRPQRFRRGPAQREILSRLEVSDNGFNRQLVSEALSELGYAKVKIAGILFYRRKL